MPVDKGSTSFKGYSPKESFYTESEDMNGWTKSATAGAVLGFTVYGIGILFAVTMIIADMRKRN